MESFFCSTSSSKNDCDDLNLRVTCFEMFESTNHIVREPDFDWACGALLHEIDALHASNIIALDCMCKAPYR